MNRKNWLLIACVGMIVPYAAAKPGLENAFFAMDTGVKDANYSTVERQAALLKTLGYDGLGYTGFDGLPELIQRLDSEQLQLNTIYMWGTVDQDGYQIQPGLQEALPLIRGRNVILWITISSNTWKLSDPQGDERAVEMLRGLSDLAMGAGAKVALYPHSGCWLERAEDAYRLAERVGRRNVGVTFNLCHWLKINGPEHLEGLIQMLIPRLMAVTINGADTAGDWDRLIQTLDRGAFDVYRLFRVLASVGYSGPFGLQGYGIGGDVKDNLTHSMQAWRSLSARAAADRPSRLLLEDLSGFRDPLGDWMVVGEAFQDPANEKRLTSDPGTGVALNGLEGKTAHLVTKAEYGDVEAHIEFMVPKGSNSGVYFQGRYEIQILDSWGEESPGYGDCGGIYQRWHEEPGLEDSQRGYEGRAPRVNASRPPGEWQTYDVVFRGPRFDASGNKTASAEFVKVVHNGVVIHEHQEVTGPTRAALYSDEKPLGPLMFQGDHGPVAYRNICIRALDGLPPGSVAMGTGEDLYAALKRYDFGQSRTVLLAIERSLTGATAAQQQAMEGRFLEVLQAPGVSFAAKQFACKMLSRVGSAAAFPVLAPMLLDEKLSSMACYALQPMPDSGVESVLAEALGKASTPLVQIGIINVLGERRNPDSASVLLPLASEGNPAVVAAALDALSKIGGAPAIEAAQRARGSAEPAIQQAAYQGLLLAANRQLDASEGDKGAALFDDLYATAPTPAIRASAFKGSVLARGEQGVSLLSEAISGDDASLQAAAWPLVRELRGSGVTEQLSGLALVLSGKKKALLLRALSDRADPRAASTASMACMDEDLEVRISGLEALGVLGDASSVSILSAAAAMGSGPDCDAARRSLVRLPGKGIDEAMIETLDSAPALAQIELVKALALRRAQGALPKFLEKARDADANLRVESLNALVELAGYKNIPALLDILFSPVEPGDAPLAEKAIVAAAQRGADSAQRTGAVLAAFSGAPSAVEKIAILRILGAIGDPSGLPTLRGALADPSLEIQDAAVRALSGWPTLEALSDLGGLAERSSNPVHRVLALRAYIRLLSLPDGRAEEERLKAFMAAYAWASQAEEKRQILSAVSGLAIAGTLDFIEPQLADPELQAEASAAIIKLSGVLRVSQPERVIAALDKAIGVVSDEDLRAQARVERSKAVQQWLNGQSIASKGEASSPDDIEMDGGSQGDDAAIDGNADTFWDEVDGQPLYRYQLTFTSGESISAVSIMGYGHQDYAPKDFEILGDGQVLQRVTDAAYTDNWLLVDFPKTVCKVLELRITGYYGKSPAIRELGVFSSVPAHP